MLLSVFAAFGYQGFGKTLGGMLTLAFFYCLFAAVIRRERPFGPELTHFDEAAAYLLVAHLAAWAL
jgi:hypothetical protein